MEVVAALVADGQAAESGEPSEGALDHPAVSSEARAALDPAAGDARGDAAGAALTTAAAVVVGLVGVELGGPAAGSSPLLGPHARHRIKGWGQHAAVVAVGAAQCQAKRRAAGIHDEVALGARLAAIRRVRAGASAPPLYGMTRPSFA